MAKKRRKTTTSRRRRSRVGATSGAMNTVLGVAVGAIAARLISGKLLPNVDEKIKNGAILAAGIFAVPKFIKGGFGAAIGNGMVAAGSIGLLSDLGVLAGIDDFLIPVTVSGLPDSDGINLIAGNNGGAYGGTQVMAGNQNSVLAGIEDEDNDRDY
jgi:hypothetical protein